MVRYGLLASAFRDRGWQTHRARRVNDVVQGIDKKGYWCVSKGSLSMEGPSSFSIIGLVSVCWKWYPTIVYCSLSVTFLQVTTWFGLCFQEHQRKEGYTNKNAMQKVRLSPSQLQRPPLNVGCLTLLCVFPYRHVESRIEFNQWLAEAVSNGLFT